MPFDALLSVRMLRVHGEPSLLSCIYDITDFKRIERAKRDSDARYRILTESAEVGISQLDAAWRCVYANPALCRILEVTDHIEIGDGIADFAVEDSKARIRAER
ncbi:MAG: PAS domain-containing protein [Alphaproteobacteria bacterium]|nr:PAS domain-containing protein [Alphaproteobacteria bacterium]